jgi:rhamnosyltransferase
VTWLRVQTGAANIVVLPLAANLGVAAAHNRGIGWARERGFRYVLLMDQDSIPTSGMVRALLAAMIGLTQRGEKIAACGPRCVDQRTSHEAPFVKFGFIRNQHSYCAGALNGTSVAADFLISSGSLIPVAVVGDIGGMEEGLFIDNIDMEWCFRAAGAGYHLYGVCDAVMSHQLGDDLVNLWFLRSRSYALHNPVRLYYMMRNRVLLYGRRYTPKRWIFRDLFRLAGKLLLYSVVLPPRIENAKMMLAGLWHGLLGRTGKCP